ncbi:hypothetical protein CgunFtcFv8_005142 [Champsocephalus gunnari]|uniref:Uncharacterized protein n=1 Tax=Champsocephalus gunnari TaxID=52237 RepID=A0AAN8HCF7_CHAGU|nr:hypothetical protein CgunFtcFv8_005142 [Champsocephalus gunnari]
MNDRKRSIGTPVRTCVCAWKKTPVCTRINDRGVKASRSGRLRPTRESARIPELHILYMHINPRRNAAPRSRDVKGKAGDSCLRQEHHMVTFSQGDTTGSRIRHEKN